MIKKTSGFLAAALLMGLASCSDDNPWAGDAGQGAIKLSLTADGSVKDAIPETRANGADYFRVPEADEFSVHLEKHDGSFSKIYETLGHFTGEKSFPTGAYNLRVFYGRVEDQGFDKPFLEGSETINVLEARTTEVTVHATVANSLVNINYSDNFKDYLHNYKTVLTTPHGAVEYEADEKRTGFVAPGEVGMTVSFTNPQGQSVTLQPAALVARAGHHYNVTFDVKGGESYEPRLDIIFDDELTQETVTIDLTEELFTSPAPSVALNAEGIDAAGDEMPVIEFLAGSGNTDKYRFTVVSHGGIDKVNLSLGSDNNFNTGFGETLELVGSTPSQQAALANLGFDVKGLFKNPDRMALVDFTALPAHLPAGNYVLTLQAVDKFTRASEPVSVKLVSVAPTLEARGLSAVYGSNKGSVEVVYNGSNPEADIAFKAMNAGGRMVDCPVESAVEVQKTRSISSHTYLFVIQLPDMERKEIPVDVYLYGTKAASTTLEVESPDLSADADAFARKALIKFKDEDQAAVIAQNVKVYDGTALIPESRLVRDVENGMVTVSGLEADKDYTFTLSLRTASDSDARQVACHTESENQAPNSDFSDMSQTINIGNIQVGSKYYMIRAVVYTNVSSISVFTPNQWGNINDITCNQSVSPSSSGWNTWYLVPSTIGNQEEKSVTVRTVGYSHNGPQLDNSIVVGSSSGVYYGRTTPKESDLTVGVGELFLGNRDSGFSFTTRPSSLTFDYTYNSVYDETGKAEVAVYSGGKLIASGTTTVAAGSGKATVNIEGYTFGNKADSIKIKFLSSSSAAPKIIIPTGTDLKDNDSWNPPSFTETLPANSYKAFASGSSLTVSNVKLNY